jgi:hypothetical protein
VSLADLMSHILPARVSDCDYDILLAHVSGQLDDVSCSSRLHAWFQHDNAGAKCVSGCPKIIRDSGLVAEVKFSFLACALT